MSEEKFVQGICWIIIFSFCRYSFGSRHVNIPQEVMKYSGEISWGTRLLDRYLEIESVNIRECAIECLRRRRCESFNYSPVMNFCELCYVELANGRRDNNRTTTAFLQSDVKTWNKGLAGNCASHSCDINSTCNFVNGSCEVSDCGREQEIENSTPLHYGHHEIGNAVFYICNENHDMRNIHGDVIPGGQVAALCNKEGKWEVPHFGCYEICPSSWIPYSGHHYCFVKEKTSWMVAKERCLKKNAHLVKLDGKEEFQWIKEQIRGGPKEYRSVWLGGIRHSQDSWIWEKDKSSISKIINELWAPGEPNNHDKKEDCMELADVGSLNDIICDAEMEYICKR